MANQPTSATIGKTDPGYPNDKASVTKSVSKQGGNDTVTVDAYEDTSLSGKALVVLKISSNGSSTVSVDANKTVQLVASGSGTVMYVSVAMSASDPNNWTVKVNTSGGSNYTFVKGGGGGGPQK